VLQHNLVLVQFGTFMEAINDFILFTCFICESMDGMKCKPSRIPEVFYQTSVLADFSG